MANIFNADGISYCITEAMTASGIQRYASVMGFREDLDIAHIRANVRDVPVTAILDEAAYNHEYLREVYIPASVTEIGKRAFANCICLQYAHFVGNSEEVILQEDTFQNCVNLITVFGSRHLYLFGEKIFQNCGKLLTIPDLSGGIPNLSFNGCKKLQKVCVTDTNRFSYISDCGLFKSGIKTICVIGDAAFSDKAITDLIKQKITIKSTPSSMVENLAYSGVLVDTIS